MIKKFLEKIALKKELFAKNVKKAKPEYTLYDVIALFIVSTSITILFGFGMGYFQRINVENKTNVDKLDNEYLEKFINNYLYIRENYYMDFNESEVLDSAIKAILESLGDPNTSYIDNANSFNLQLNGQFVGLGIAMNNYKEGIIITGVFDGSPADRAGIKPGDILISVNGIDFSDKSSAEVPKYISANRGPFRVKIIRNELEKEFLVNKENIVIPSVEHRVINNVGYIGIDIFSKTTPQQFKLALNELKKENINGLVIDLRGNAGGHLSSAYDMISNLLDKDKVVYIAEAKGKIETFYSKGGKDYDKPIVILVDQGSASASELMAAALRDNLGSLIVGTTTYGKGTVQEVHSVGENTSYRITIKKWLTPNGDWIHNEGITPDHIINYSPEHLLNPKDENDVQLQKALELIKR